MALLMFLVVLAIVPDDSGVFGIVHWPLIAFVDFLDTRFHVFPDDADTDFGYMRNWFTWLLCYWSFLGVAVGIGIWSLGERRRIHLTKAAPMFMMVAWLFIAGVLTWSLRTIHSYDGHWGILLDSCVTMLVLVLALIALWLARAVWTRRASV